MSCDSPFKHSHICIWSPKLDELTAAETKHTQDLLSLSDSVCRLELIYIRTQHIGVHKIKANQ